jgi:hypothetical protein
MILGSTTVLSSSSATGVETFGDTLVFCVVSVTLSAVQEYKEKLTTAKKKSWDKNFGFIKNHFKKLIKGVLVEPSGPNDILIFLKRREVFCSAVLRSFPSLKQRLKL